MRDVYALVEVIEEMDKPFDDESGYLMKLDTRDIAEPAMVALLQRASQTGQQQYEE